VKYELRGRNINQGGVEVVKEAENKKGKVGEALKTQIKWT
jgi:hypothetical protein